jgi:RNA polymerase sigma-70 factor (ECF subfamily)
MTDPDTTHDLVIRAQRGDRKAFDELMRKYIPRLRTVVEVRLGSWLRQKVEAEDLVQETVARALESLERFSWQGKESFRLWLEGIAGNLIREAVKRHRRSLGIAIPRFASNDPSPSRQARREERFDRLQAAVDNLSEDHRRVILLARIEGLKMKEIARRMDRSTGAVKTLLFRAMQELRKSFGDTESLRLPGRSLENRGGEDVETG